MGPPVVQLSLVAQFDDPERQMFLVFYDRLQTLHLMSMKFRGSEPHIGDGRKKDETGVAMRDQLCNSIFPLHMPNVKSPKKLCMCGSKSPCKHFFRMFVYDVVGRSPL